MSSVLDQLLEMGFTQTKAEKALKYSGNTDIEAAMKWLVENDKESSDENSGLGETNNKTEESKNGTKNDQPRSFQCEDCKKCLRNDYEVQLHSARTGHVNYAESSEELKPLTEEERKEQVEKLQEILRQKKLQREKEEEQKEIEREKQRRIQGKTLSSAKTKFEEDEVRRLVEQKKREKDEDRVYREKLKAEIAREREEKRSRGRGEMTVPTQSKSTKSAIPVSQSDSKICRLLIRPANGPPMKAEFNSSETLNAVILYIAQHWHDFPVDPQTVRVMTSFPQRAFESDDLNSSLSDLGLCPSAVLIARLQ